MTNQLSPWDKKAITDIIEPLIPRPHEPGPFAQLFDDLVESEGVWAVFPPWIGTIAKVLAGFRAKSKAKAVLRELLDVIVGRVLSPGFELSSAEALLAPTDRLDTDGLPHSLRRRALAVATEAITKPSFVARCEEVGAKRYLNVRYALLDRAVKGPGDPLKVTEKLVKLYAEAIELAFNPHDTAVPDLLTAIATACSVYCCRDAVLDANYMDHLDKKDSLWPACQRSAEATRIFGQGSFRDAAQVFLLRYSTNPTIKDFWIPHYPDLNRNLPGAVAAARTMIPQIVHCNDQLSHGNGSVGGGWSVDEVAEMGTYFGATRFRTFITFPIVVDNRVTGVVNVNLDADDFVLYVPEVIKSVGEAVKPLLAALSGVVHKTEKE